MLPRDEIHQDDTKWLKRNCKSKNTIQCPKIYRTKRQAMADANY